MQSNQKIYRVYLGHCCDIFPSIDGISEKAAISAWSSLEKNVSKYVLKDESSATKLSIDWNGASEYVEKMILLNSEVLAENRFSHSSDDFKHFLSIQPRPLEVVVTINSEDVSDQFCSSFIELFFSYVYLALNFSAPGCANFSGAHILSDKSKRQNNDFALASFMLESAWRWSSKLSWPSIDHIEFENCWQWILGLNLGTRQVAVNNTEKMIFSLLHACNEWQPSPSQLIWLANTLEAIFDLPESSILKTLRERIFLTLSTPQKNGKKIRKHINDFYDLRSKFVHGSLTTYHPICDDGLDMTVNEIENAFLNPIDLGFSVILSVVQKMINSNWKEIKFTESLEGV